MKCPDSLLCLHYQESSQAYAIDVRCEGERKHSGVVRKEDVRTGMGEGKAKWPDRILKIKLVEKIKST